MGMGHIFRQVNLTRKLREYYYVNVLVNDDEAAISILRENQISYCVYDNSMEICSLLRERNSELLIIDMLDTDKNDIQMYREYVKKIVSFDDRGSGTLENDYVINAIVPVKYPSAHVLSGEDYMIFNEAAEKCASREKEISTVLKTVFISFGGSDPMNYTNKIDGIFEQFSDCEFWVTIGPNYNHKEMTMQRMCMHKNVKCISNCNNLAEYIYNADICIISGGLTLYEASYIGTPCIVLCQVEHQLVTADKFEKKYGCINLGIMEDVQCLSDAIQKLEDFDYRKKMSINQKQFISQNGTNRILKLIQKIEEEL